MVVILSIAGSDTSGGAGIQADIKTITGLGAHALTVVTALTAQNSLGVSAIHKIPPDFVAKQMDQVIQDIPVQAVKIGMLHGADTVRAVTDALKRYGLRLVVIDPVMRATAGGDLLEPSAVDLFKSVLHPLADVLTPNLEEAGVLTGRPVNSLEEMKEAAGILHGLGPDVVVTGGHLAGTCIDVVYHGDTLECLEGPRIETKNTHGSGCVFSSAMATFKAMGFDTMGAAREAHEYTRQAIERGYPCGRGQGTVYPPLSPSR
jgi:hydroxymethylpyrimidine kinase/phosphomethylpyrimidine kinase